MLVTFTELERCGLVLCVDFYAGRGDVSRIGWLVDFAGGKFWKPLKCDSRFDSILI